MSAIASAGKGTWVAARSNRGTLAHAIYVRDLHVFERKPYVVPACRQVETNVLVADGFDLDADEHRGHRTCQRCVTGVRESEEMTRILREYR